MPRLNSLLLLSFVLPTVHAATVTYDFNVTWVNANPDGQQERRVIGINNQWPLPTIEVTVGDRLIVNMYNGLGDQSTSIHFHGLFQNGTAAMDGPVGVTQCAVAPGQSITYDFIINQPGTYWYHSHMRGQYPDGFRGPLIVHDPADPHRSLYNSSITLTFSDWYHTEMPILQRRFLSVYNPTGAEPVPDSALINDSQNIQLNVEPGRTYFFRMVNIGAFAAMYVWFEGHTMRVVEVDGVYTQPYETERLYITAAQRYGVLVTMRNDTGANFPFVGSMDEDLFDQVPSGLNPNVTGWLVYDAAKALPTPALIPSFDHLDDFLLVPEDGEGIFENPDYSITLDFKMDNLGDGANYAFFNDVTYVFPVVPTLYTALSAGSLATNPQIYGDYTNSFVLRYNQIIEIIVNSNDPGKHPFHLHGHNFQLAYRSDEEAGPYNASEPHNFPRTPMRRDTVQVRPNGNMVLRFRADNPGVWLFHCHLEWHLISGLIATMVEAPLELQNQTIPEQHLEICRGNGIPTQGNAAGNTVDYLDLTGQNGSPDPLPTGFTARGIVALVFSTICAFVGIGVVCWYGAVDVVDKGSAGLG